MPTDAKQLSSVGLDYSIRRTLSGWEIWTPDSNGACIGSGKTQQEAKEDTVRNLELTCEKMMGMKLKPR